MNVLKDFIESTFKLSWHVFKVSCVAGRIIWSYWATHSLEIAEANECKEIFIGYFNDGVSEAHKYHHLRMKEDFEAMQLAQWNQPFIIGIHSEEIQIEDRAGMIEVSVYKYLFNI